MKAKKIMGIALLACAIGQVSMAEKTDPNIERLLKIAKQKKEAEEKEARKQELLNSVTEEGETVPVTVVSPSKTAPKTNEKLEYNANKAAIKVDFYERVVRSVAREEKELDGYNEVLGKKKTAKVKQQKAEKPAKTKKK